MKNEVKNAFRTDAIDHLMFEGIRDYSKVDSLCTDANVEGIVQDCFTGCYGVNPQIDPETAATQKGLIEQMLTLPEYRDLRASTVGDEISSAMGALQLAPGLIEQVKELEKKAEKGEPSNFNELPEGEQSSIRQALRRGLQEAQEKADQWQDTAASWGVDASELKQVEPAKRLELAEKLLEAGKIQRISELLGRFKNVVNGATATVPVHGQDEIVDIGLSSDIERMLPSEVVKLIETPELFYADMIEGKLLTYNLKGTENLGRGPIVALLDCSDSMSTHGREEWAKAVVLSLLQLATNQKRAFGLVVFNHGVKSTKFWPADVPATLQDKLEIAQLGPSGGTSFYNPLKKGFELRQREPKLLPADLVLITDGDCQLTDEQQAEILKLKNDTQVRIHSICIDIGGYGSSGETVKDFSDHISHVKSDGDIETVEGLVAKASSNQLGQKEAA